MTKKSSWTLRASVTCKHKECIDGWQRRGWRTSDKQAVKNQNLSQELLAAMGPHKIHWHWVKGHAGHAENERCAQLANQAVAADRLSVDTGFDPARG